MTGGLLVVGVDLDGARVDVRAAGGVVTEVADGLVPRRGETVLRGSAALLPGLHDHHLHLLAMAARDRSVDLGPGSVNGAADLRRVLRSADAALPPGAWIRAVGHHERTGGRLDRWVLDAVVADRPVRVQHRSGHLWVVNSAGWRALVAGGPGAGPDGVERDDRGEPTGRLFDADRWVADRLPRGADPDLGAVSRRLASYGVTGVTDATPTRSVTELEALAGARRSGAVVQRVRVMGRVPPDGPGVPDELEVGPVKVMVPDGRGADVDDLADAVAAAHRSGRAVALHCVSRVAAVLALAAWDAAGARPGDRMEHGAVLPPDLVDRLARLGVTVVTQPAFVGERGDDYVEDVEPDDLPHLYPCARLDRAGVALGAGTDAPFGPEDPWVAIGSAVDRRTGSGRVLGPDERLSPSRALALFLSDPAAPGGPVRRVRVGGPADLCLLGDGLDATLSDPGSRRVVATVVDGTVVHEG